MIPTLATVSCWAPLACGKHSGSSKTPVLPARIQQRPRHPVPFHAHLFACCRIKSTSKSATKKRITTCISGSNISSHGLLKFCCWYVSEPITKHQSKRCKHTNCRHGSTRIEACTAAHDVKGLMQRSNPFSKVEIFEEVFPIFLRQKSWQS